MTNGQIFRCAVLAAVRSVSRHGSVIRRQGKESVVDEAVCESARMRAFGLERVHGARDVLICLLLLCRRFRK